MYYRILIFIAIFPLTLSACENIGKRSVFNALQEQSKYDCELANANECPRSPGNYDDYHRQRDESLEGSYK